MAELVNLIGYSTQLPHLENCKLNKYMSVRKCNYTFMCSKSLVYLKPGKLLLSGGNFGFQPFPDVLISKQTFRLLSEFFA